MLKIVKDNMKYTLVPNNTWLDSIQKIEEIFNNGLYEKYKINLNISGELIVCNDLTKIENFNYKIISETYTEYLKYIEDRDLSKDQWIYDIIDKKTEQNKILYQDDDIIIIPDYSWNENILDRMHLLTIPTDKNIRCIRTLNNSHVNLLQKIKNKTLEIIKNKYGFDTEQIKMFVHYTPSTYHLHVHFSLVSNTEINSSVEYSHELTNIIFNLEMNGDYYKLAILNKRV